MDFIRAILRSISPKAVQRFDMEYSAYQQYSSEVLSDNQPEAVVDDIVRQIENYDEFIEDHDLARFTTHIVGLNKSVMRLTTQDENRSVTAGLAQKWAYAKIRWMIRRRLTHGGVWTRHQQAIVWDALPADIYWVEKEDGYDIEVTVVVRLRNPHPKR